jgi:hypothetical protein
MAPRLALAGLATIAATAASGFALSAPGEHLLQSYDVRCSSTSAGDGASSDSVSVYCIYVPPPRVSEPVEGASIETADADGGGHCREWLSSRSRNGDADCQEIRQTSRGWSCVPWNKRSGVAAVSSDPGDGAVCADFVRRQDARR